MKRFPFLLLAWAGLAVSAWAQASLHRVTLSAGSLDANTFTFNLAEPLAFSPGNGRLGIGAQPGDEPISVGTIDKGDMSGVSVYPNPTNAILRVVLDDLTLRDVQGQLFDASGRLILTTSLSGGVNTLNLQQQPAGAYVLRLGLGEKSTLFQIIKH